MFQRSAYCICAGDFYSREKIQIMNLTQAKPEMADMQTVVIIGSSQTKALIQTEKLCLYTEIL